MSQNSSVRSSCPRAGRRGAWTVAADEALGGVGGFAGRKKEGRDAIVAWVAAGQPSKNVHGDERGSSHDDGDVENHVWDLARFFGPE